MFKRYESGIVLLLLLFFINISCKDSSNCFNTECLPRTYNEIISSEFLNQGTYICPSIDYEAKDREKRCYDQISCVSELHRNKPPVPEEYRKCKEDKDCILARCKSSDCFELCPFPVNREHPDACETYLEHANINILCYIPQDLNCGFGDEENYMESDCMDGAFKCPYVNTKCPSSVKCENGLCIYESGVK